MVHSSTFDELSDPFSNYNQQRRKLKQCPRCNGTGDIGGNPSYGPCDLCGATGKIEEVTSIPSPKAPPMADDLIERLLSGLPTYDEPQYDDIGMQGPEGYGSEGKWVKREDLVSAIAALRAQPTSLSGVPGDAAVEARYTAKGAESMAILCRLQPKAVHVPTIADMLDDMAKRLTAAYAIDRPHVSKPAGAWNTDLSAAPRDRDFLIQFNHGEVTLGHYLDNSKTSHPFEGIRPARSLRPERPGEKVTAWCEVPGPLASKPMPFEERGICPTCAGVGFIQTDGRNCPECSGSGWRPVPLASKQDAGSGEAKPLDTPEHRAMFDAGWEWHKEMTPPTADPHVKALEVALRELLHAACGNNGFAGAVRAHSQTAYPWPALDIAEERALKVLGISP